MPSDLAAQGHLTQVMSAAGLHDLDSVIREADATLAILAPFQPHKARADVLAIKDHATAGRWRAAHAAAWHAMCGLTHTFPPDPSACPPTPDDERALSAAPFCSTCEIDLPVGARFCMRCGSPV